MQIDLPPNVWKSVKLALEDFLRFGPGDFAGDHIPDEHLQSAIKEIEKKEFR